MTYMILTSIKTLYSGIMLHSDSDVI